MRSLWWVGVGFQKSTHACSRCMFLKWLDQPLEKQGVPFGVIWCYLKSLGMEACRFPMHAPQVAGSATWETRGEAEGRHEGGGESGEGGQPPMSHRLSLNCHLMVHTVQTVWALVSEPGFLKFQIFDSRDICSGDIFSKYMLVRYRGINNKGVMERPWTKWRGFWVPFLLHWHVSLPSVGWGGVGWSGVGYSNSCIICLRPESPAICQVCDRDLVGEVQNSLLKFEVLVLLYIVNLGNC